MQSFILIFIFKNKYIFKIYNWTLLQEHLKNYNNKRYNKIRRIKKHIQRNQCLCIIIILFYKNKNSQHLLKDATPLLV